MRYIKIFEDFSNFTKSIVELSKNLKDYGIPVEEWGTGSAKTIDHLLDELRNKECIIKKEENSIVRYIEFVGISVFYKEKNGNILYLNEDRQEFKDGRIRKRKMSSSVSEKMKFGEDPLISAVRGIEEELGISVDMNQLKRIKHLNFDGDSLSYPGLKSKYTGHKYTCYITDDQFNPEGYVENQSDKNTFFKWTKYEK